MFSLWSGSFALCVFLAVLCLWNCYFRFLEFEVWNGCRNEQGQPIDLFIVYKLPKLNAGKWNHYLDGMQYMYLTPASEDRYKNGGVSSIFNYSDSFSDWILSDCGIGEADSIVGKTLSKLYGDSRNENVLFAMYNDEFPNNTMSMTKGHTKGVVYMTMNGGFWLVHSVPKFPPESYNGYSYPESAHHYGQSMLCVSLPPSQADNLGWQLLQNDVFIYDFHVGSGIHEKYPVLEEVIKGKKLTPKKSKRVIEITSLQGKRFISFAKNKLFNEDLYSGLVAPDLKANLLVESWQNGPNKLPSYCNSSFSVMNVQEVSLKNFQVSFKETHDHSKWAVTTNVISPYVCIGDINRMETQMHRGGGTLCMWSVSVWHRFNGIVSQSEACPPVNTSRHFR